MSIETTLTLVTLPVELLYYIFDQLDINDILLSLRNVCTQFRAMTNTYNRYKVRYTSTSVKADIHRICRIIRPEHVMSMSLTNSHRYEISDRIELFFSLIDIHQFTHLHSLDLFDIDDNNLKNILQYIITVPTLKNLSIGIKYIENFSDQTVDLLSTVITTSGIHKLHLFSMNYMILKIAWSSKSKLEHLALDSCSSQQLCYILDHLPNLRILSSDHYYSVKTDPIIFPSTVHRLTSLKLHSTGMTMNYLESLLSFTPSLVRLQLMNYFTIFDFLQRLSQWEYFIRKKLPILETFKFHVSIKEYSYTNVKDLESIINGFRTPFWFQLKYSCVTCKYLNNSARSEVMLYSSTDSSNHFLENTLSGNMSYFTSTNNNDNIVEMNSKWKVRFNVLHINDAIHSKQLHEPTDYIFHNMTHLALDIDWPINSFDFLSTFANYLHLIELWLFLHLNHHYFESKTMDILLDLAYNVQTVGISYDNDSTLIPENILDSVISHRVKHLIVRTTDAKCMQLILEYVQNLSSVTFIRDRASANSWIDISNWLDERGSVFSLSEDLRSLRVYLEDASVFSPTPTPAYIS